MNRALCRHRDIPVGQVIGQVYKHSTQRVVFLVEGNILSVQANLDFSPFLDPEVIESSLSSSNLQNSCSEGALGQFIKYPYINTILRGIHRARCISGCNTLPSLFEKTVLKRKQDTALGMANVQDLCRNTMSSSKLITPAHLQMVFGRLLSKTSRLVTRLYYLHRQILVS